MAPDRKSDFAGVVFRAFISGSVACFLTACIAGTLYDQAVYDTDFFGTFQIDSDIYYRRGERFCSYFGVPDLL